MYVLVTMVTESAEEKKSKIVMNVKLYKKSSLFKLVLANF